MTEWRQSFPKMSEIVITDEKKLLSALGLCARAGKLTVGIPLICEAMKRGRDKMPKIVFEASDTSPNTHKRICDRCAFYGVRLVRISSDAMTLAAAVGKHSPIGAVAVTSAQMSCLTEKYIQFGSI